jgi:hypothetical protein
VIHNAMIARRRNLRDNDGSNYATLRLVVQRQGLTRAVCSVVVERVGGHQISGTRLAFAHISVLDPGGRALAPEDLLERALEALRLKA